MKIGFVIPCYRSELTVASVIDEIRSVVSKIDGCGYHIVCVNDGSPDNVYHVLKELAAEDPNICVLDLMRNFSQENARIAGLTRVQADYIVCLDDDGQCPMDQLEKLIAPLKNGYDMAIAKYPQKKQSAFKNFGSKVNSVMTHWLLDMPADIEMSNFFAFTEQLKNEIIEYRNPYPFITGLVFRATRKVVNVPMEERERLVGTTGYTFKKLLKMWMNGFTNFSVTPLRIADATGAVCAFAGFIYAIIIIITKLVNPNIAVGYSSLASLILIIGGIIMLLVGMVGEYVGRIFICINQTPQFVVRNELNGRDASERDRIAMRDNTNDN